MTGIFISGADGLRSIDKKNHYMGTKSQDV